MTKKVWKSSCREYRPVQKTAAPRDNLYSLQRRISVEPSSRTTGSRKGCLRPGTTTLKNKEAAIINERSWLASFSLCSPNFFAMRALPPLANMTPTAIIRLITGNTIFAEDSALLPTNREINIPSTIVYKEVKTIIIIVGSANLSSEKKTEVFSN